MCHRGGRGQSGRERERERELGSGSGAGGSLTDLQPGLDSGEAKVATFLQPYLSVGFIPRRDSTGGGGAAFGRSSRIPAVGEREVRPQWWSFSRPASIPVQGRGKSEG